MGVVKLSTAGITDFQKYSSLLAGNAAYSPGAFDLLETQVLASSAASVTFSSLSSYAADYQHLQIRVAARTNRSSADLDNLGIRLNSDSAGNYSWHQFGGDGTVFSGAGTSTTFMLSGIVGAADQASTVFGGEVTDLLDAFETSKYTTSRTFAGASTTGGKQVALRSGSWRNTAAVSQIDIISITGSSFVTGSRFSLYGIKAA